MRETILDATKNGAIVAIISLILSVLIFENVPDMSIYFLIGTPIGAFIGVFVVTIITEMYA